MNERKFTAEQVRALMLKGWETGWDAHQAFVDCCPDALREPQRTDGVCTCEAQVIESGTRGVLILPDKVDPRCVQHGPGGVFGPPLATADDVIEGRARYSDTAGGRADRETLAKEAGE